MVGRRVVVWREAWATALVAVACAGVSIEDPPGANAGAPSAGRSAKPGPSEPTDMSSSGGSGGTVHPTPPGHEDRGSPADAGSSAGGEPSTPEGGRPTNTTGGAPTATGGTPSLAQGGADEAGGEAGAAGAAGASGGECGRGTRRLTRGDYLNLGTRADLETLRDYSHFVGNLNISSVELITNLSALHCLESVNGGFWIDARSGLQSLVGLENLKRISQYLVIFGAQMPDLRGLDGLTAVGELDVSDVGSLHGLESLGTIKSGLYISSSGLKNLDGLEGLTSVSEIQIRIATEVEDVEGLRNVTALDRLELTGNTSLGSLEGLRNLTQIRGDLEIGEYCTTTAYPECFYNFGLTSLYGLRSLGAVDGDFIVRNNPELPACEAEWLRDSVGSADIGGDIVLENNEDAGTCLAE